MTTTTQPQTAGLTPASNPHLVGFWVTLVAVPVVFLGALWGAGHDPQHAGLSAFAVLAIIGIHLIKRTQKALWERRHRKDAR